ncbi:hypothetical protein [uncultured Psychroserpens sp.]|uniref:hypothetical protein n=1 Tax=uncultured Psychroserpens sp. TaxID=255436 RepID=UPI00262DD11C|nr:hypothetical protein [uncultured Psychroserpens sp.]
MNKMKILRVITILFTTVLVSCSSDDDGNTNQIEQRQFGIFKVLDNDTTIEMDGTIGSSSLDDFNNLEAEFPNVDRIQIKNCDGSSDDTINLQLSLKVHQKGMNIRLMDNGLIASGGVDFFLAGIQRTKGVNTMIGVHSWSDGSGTEATDFPVGHANHLPYINYYMNIGFSQQWAESFYYFTINAAPADSIHWMTELEITEYDILTQ